MCVWVISVGSAPTLDPRRLPPIGGEELEWREAAPVLLLVVDVTHAGRQVRDKYPTRGVEVQAVPVRLVPHNTCSHLGEMPAVSPAGR